MHGKKLLAVAGVIAVLLVITGSLLLFVSPRLTVTVWHSHAARSNDVFLLTFQITNHTGNAYVFYPYEVEAKEGPEWKRCFQFWNNPPPRLGYPTLAANAFLAYTCTATNLPSGCSLRFKMRVQKQLEGLESFMRRVKLRQSGVFARDPISLNPFGRDKVFGMPVEIVSDEFTPPPLPASTEPAADSPGSK